MFGSLLERPLVAAYALTQYPRLVAMFDKELDCCMLIYDRHFQSSQELGERDNLSFFSYFLYFIFALFVVTLREYNICDNNLFILI